jgi:glycosyltransferase involved in cell wall biosynthesis
MKKKILMIHHSGLIGGAGISFYNTWLALEEKYSVVSYIADDPPDLLMFLRDKGLNPHTFPFRLGKLTYYSGGNNLLKPRFWYHALHSLFQISYWKKIICKEQPDLIIVNSKVLCWMGRIFKKFNIKSVCFVRETILGSPKKLMNRIMRNMLDDFTLVSFISNYDLKETGLTKAKAIVLYDFLDVANYYDKLGKIVACEQLNISPDSFNVLFVGGINHLKGIDIAVRSLASLKNEDITLIVSGNDSGAAPNIGFRSLADTLKRRNSIRFSKEVKKYIKNESIEKKIKFIGVQSDMSIPYSACDVLIFPMKEPHQARPAFEIGIQKKTVIISDFPHIHEFVRDGYNGLTFEPLNSKKLAVTIMKIKDNRTLLRELGENNYQHAMQHHTKINVMKALLKEIDMLTQ